MIHQIKDSADKPTDKKLNLAFDLYSKEIDDGNRNERVTTFAYEISTSPNNANILKNPLYRILNEGNAKL